jgi:hypothetical protein
MNKTFIRSSDDFSLLGCESSAKSLGDPQCALGVTSPKCGQHLLCFGGVGHSASPNKRKIRLTDQVPSGCTFVHPGLFYEQMTTFPSKI